MTTGPESFSGENLGTRAKVGAPDARCRSSRPLSLSLSRSLRNEPATATTRATIDPRMKLRRWSGLDGRMGRNASWITISTVCCRELGPDLIEGLFQDRDAGGEDAPLPLHRRGEAEILVVLGVGDLLVETVQIGPNDVELVLDEALGGLNVLECLRGSELQVARRERVPPARAALGSVDV